MAAAAGGDWLYFRSPVNDDGQPTHSWETKGSGVFSKISRSMTTDGSHSSFCSLP